MKMLRCRYASRYKGKRPPKCRCATCHITYLKRELDRARAVLYAVQQRLNAEDRDRLVFAATGVLAIGCPFLPLNLLPSVFQSLG